MRTLAQLLSALALGATIVPAGLYLTDALAFGAMQTWMLAAAALWFAATPFWMERKRP